MGCARRACRVSLNPSTRRSPTAWAWASRSAARSSKPMVGGCGRPGASRGVLSFSLRSPLTEPPSTRRKSRLLTNGGCHVHGLVRLRIISNKTAGSYKERTRRLHQIRVQKASISASGLDLRQTRICRDRTQSVGFSYRGGDRGLWGSNRRNCLVVFPSAIKCLVEGDQLNACHALGDDVLGFEFKLLSLGIQDVEEVRQPSLIALGRKPDCIKGRAAGAGKARQPTLFGVVTGNRLVYLLHGT